MPLKEAFMIKADLDLGNGEVLTLTADTGESFLVKDVIVYGADTPYADLYIDKAIVGRFRVSGNQGSHLSPSYGVQRNADEPMTISQKSFTILRYLFDKGIFKGYPVAEGQSFKIKPSDDSKKLGAAVIIYERYEAGDISKEDENGSESGTYLIVNYGRPLLNVVEGGDYLCNTFTGAIEFPAFPFGADVPAKTEIEIYGILGTEVMDYDAADDYTRTKYLKMIRGREVLFDEDRNGLVHYGDMRGKSGAGTYYGRGFSVIGEHSEVNAREPFMLPKPLTFGSGEELNIYLTAERGSAGAGSINASNLELGIIMKVKRTE
jgi:hypothetical protein